MVNPEVAARLITYIRAFSRFIPLKVHRLENGFCKAVDPGAYYHECLASHCCASAGAFCDHWAIKF
ncbi:MAG: hypothetical protein JWR19_785 [Pedosphaera sp.]|nr:hypothetical protein [Pedosphaera sp.]